MPVRESVRGRELYDTKVEWIDAPTLHTQKGGKYDNHKLVHLRHPMDLATLGKQQGHCSSAHFILACYQRITPFLALIMPSGYPRASFHLKQTTFFRREHPYDSLPHVRCNRTGMYSYSTYEDAVKVVPESELINYRTEISSHVYDSTPSFRDPRAVNDVSEDLAWYERRKREIIDIYGPPGRDNPYNQRLNEMNREIGRLKQFVPPTNESLGLHPDIEKWPNAAKPFMFNRRKYQLIGVSTKGIGLSQPELVIPFINWVVTKRGGFNA